MLQAQWLLARAAAKVRGGAVDAMLIPGVEDSARAILSRTGISALLSALLTLRQESPRQAEQIDEYFRAASSSVRWFIETDLSAAPLAGANALVTGADLLDTLCKCQIGRDLRRHLTALAESYRLLSEKVHITGPEAAELATLRERVVAEPGNVALRAELFDRESM